MTKDEAVEECKRYLEYLDGERKRSIKIQELAKLARSGSQEEAKRALRQIDDDRRNLTVYDGSKLEQAIIKLIGEMT